MKLVAVKNGTEMRRKDLFYRQRKKVATGRPVRRFLTQRHSHVPKARAVFDTEIFLPGDLEQITYYSRGSVQIVPLGHERDIIQSTCISFKRADPQAVVEKHRVLA